MEVARASKESALLMKIQAVSTGLSRTLCAPLSAFESIEAGPDIERTSVALAAPA